jgi:two-component system sensor histidine kinase VicK
LRLNFELEQLRVTIKVMLRFRSILWAPKKQPLSGLLSCPKAIRYFYYIGWNSIYFIWNRNSSFRYNLILVLFFAIGLASYSNSKSTVLSYASIFESLWNQAKLYEKLKAHDMLQKDFINVAAHELRNPIQPIVGLSEILLSKNGSIEQYKEHLEIIRKNAKRLRRLSEEILDVTRIESRSLHLKKEVINLKELISGITNEYEGQIKNKDRSNTSVDIVFVSDDHHIFVEGDKARLSQVIDNLLNNALKFTKQGSICVKITKVSKDIGYSAKNEEVLVSVRDTGIGIEPEISQRLFTRFATTSFEGTGLGLFICKSIIGSHGGKIWAENNTDQKGATFSFTLPTAT